MEWFSVADRLPEQNAVVLIKTNETHVHGYGGVLLQYHVATFRAGKVPGPGETICPEDKWGNNLVPYYWSGDGPCSWFGQLVTHWAYIVPPDEDEWETELAAAPLSHGDVT